MRVEISQSFLIADESIGRRTAFLQFVDITNAISVSPQEPDSGRAVVAGTLASSRCGGREAAAEALKSNMAASQIGPRANLDANQFESGVARACDENRKIRSGFRGQNAIGRRNVRKR
jgi:hypothetical protein